MGVFRDLFRLARAGLEESARTDYAENLRRSADLAERFSGATAQTVLGAHGAAVSNPFANMAAYATMIQGSARVIEVVDTGKSLDGDRIFAVELEVTIPEAAPYGAVYKTVIALDALPGWRPGTTMPVRVGRNDRNAIMLG